MNLKGAWEPTEWRPAGRDLPDNDLHIRLMRSPFYEGVKYAVRRGPTCLNKAGEWEYEPMPSNREDDFYARCRFDSWEMAMDTLHPSNAASPP